MKLILLFAIFMGAADASHVALEAQDAPPTEQQIFADWVRSNKSTLEKIRDERWEHKHTVDYLEALAKANLNEADARLFNVLATTLAGARREALACEGNEVKFWPSSRIFGPGGEDIDYTAVKRLPEESYGELFKRANEMAKDWNSEVWKRVREGGYGTGAQWNNLKQNVAVTRSDLDSKFGEADRNELIKNLGDLYQREEPGRKAAYLSAVIKRYAEAWRDCEIRKTKNDLFSVYEQMVFKSVRTIRDAVSAGNAVREALGKDNLEVLTKNQAELDALPKTAQIERNGSYDYEDALVALRRAEIRNADTRLILNALQARVRPDGIQRVGWGRGIVVRIRDQDYLFFTSPTGYVVEATRWDIVQ